MANHKSQAIRGGIRGEPEKNPPFKIRGLKFIRAFTLLEVMIAIAIFFMATFAILELVSNTLRNARALQESDADAGMIAAQLSLTNKLYEAMDSGDFGDIFPDCSWSRDVIEVSSNGLFRVDFLVTRKMGKREAQTTMSVLYYRPESPPGSASGGMSR